MSQHTSHVFVPRAGRGKIAASWPDQLLIDSLSMKIVLPLLLATLLMAGCAIWLIDHSAITTTRTRLAQLAVSVAEQMGRDSEQINDVLDSGSRLLEGTVDINQADTNRLQEQIRPRLTGMPLMKGVIFSDETGTRRVVTRDFNDPIYGFDSRQFYQDYLNRPDGSLIIGAPFDFVTGGQGIPVIHPVRDEAGRLKGLVTVLLKAELLSESYRSIAPGHADNIALLQLDGTPLVGKTKLGPETVAALVTHIPQSLAQDSRDDDPGEDAAPVDILTKSGQFSYLAAKKVPHLPLLAVAMTTRLGVIQGWILQASIVAGVIIAAGLILVGLTIYLGRKIAANERSLLAQAEFTNLIVDSAEVLIFVRDRDGRILRVNETAERHLGYPASALKDRDTLLSIIPPDEQARSMGAFMSNDPARFPSSHENHMITRQGERRFYRWSNVAVLNKAGGISLVIGIGEDITAAAKTRRLQERSIAAMSQAHHLAGMRYYFISDQLSPEEAATYSFYTQIAEVLDMPAGGIPDDPGAFIETFIHPDDRTQIRQQYDAFDAGTIDQYLIEYRVSKPTGEIRHIREGSKRVVDAVDNTAQAIGVIQDITDIKHTQLALERNAALMNRAQGIAKMCHWYFEPADDPKTYDDGRYHYSDNAIDIFGLPAAALDMSEADFAVRLVHPDDRDFVYETYRAFVTGPDLKYQRVYRLLLPDGSVRYLSDAGEKRLSPDGRLKLVLGISQDVTTLHLSEASLRRAESQLRHGMRIAAMGHWHAETSETTKHRYALQYSEEAAAIFGVTPAVLSQLDLTGFVGRFVLPDDQPQAQEKLLQFWNGTDTHLAMECHILRGDGAIRMVRVLAERVRMTHPSQVQIIGMVQDITDLKHHELVLRQTEMLLQHAHRLAKIGYWLWHPSETLETETGTLTYSDGLREMLGFDTPHYHGDDEVFCQMHVHADDRQAVQQAFVDYRRGLTDSYNLDYRFLRPDGEIINLRSVAMRMRDEAGHILYAIGVAQDITEQKQHEEDLIQARNDAVLANRSKTEFLANMSHELRTPLNAVIGFSELIRDQAFGGNSERYVSYAEDINNSGKLLLDLINDILDMSRIEAGRHVLSEEELSIEAVMHDCLRLISPRATDGHVALDFQFAPDLPQLYADARSLKQILLNLLSNAVKFTPADGRVQIEVGSAPEGGLLITVSDTGIGIAPETLPVLFAPFRQGDNSISRKFGGTGLGLAICRKLIELHGGGIQIDSTVGQGTTVQLTFPIERVLPVRPSGRERLGTAIAG